MAIDTTYKMIAKKLPKVKENPKPTKKTQDFRALELRIKEDSKAPHTVYFKEHAVREHTLDKPAGRTLLLLNLPPYVDEKCLSNAFSEAGNVISVMFMPKASTAEVKITKKLFEEKDIQTFKVAYIVFDKVSELDKALKLECLRPMTYDGHEIKCGMNKWIEEYNKQVYHPKDLKARIEAFMQQHDEELQKASVKEKKLEEEDDEGWMTVTKGGKVQSFARTDKVENKIMAKEALGKKRKELKNFYTFQIRESKMKHIVALRQKFEEDKKKIAQIKQSRRFKPF